jgi:hypothetical protein
VLADSTAPSLGALRLEEDALGVGWRRERDSNPRNP